jgi:hypothetical protein
MALGFAIPTADRLAAQPTGNHTPAPNVCVALAIARRAGTACELHVGRSEPSRFHSASSTSIGRSSRSKRQRPGAGAAQMPCVNRSTSLIRSRATKRNKNAQTFHGGCSPKISANFGLLFAVASQDRFFVRRNTLGSLKGQSNALANPNA